MATLVFGGLGHVGSWVVHDLVARGDEVVVLDAGAHNFDSLGLDYLQPHADRFARHAVDVLDMPSLIEVMRAHEGRIDAVIFGVAVIAGPAFLKRPYRNIETNTLGMLNVIEACRILQVPKFVNLSSGAVYGNSPAGQTEATPYMATDLYCATKIANEVLALQYGASYGIDVRNARLMAVYGPGRLPSRMHALYQALFGPLEGLRGLAVDRGRDQAMDWTHVRDSARGVIAVMDAVEARGESFNLSTGIAVAHAQIAAWVEDIVGEPTRITLGPGKFLDRNSPLDVSKARRRLAFQPHFAHMRDGLVDYAAWIRGARAGA